MVVSLLAAVSLLALGDFREVDQVAAKRLVYADMQEIAKAIRRFKQDTGYFPKEGPFALGGGVTDTELATVAHAGATAAARARWYNSPANFYPLLTGPLLPATHQLADWNAETGRGWHGPYLTGFREGYVDVGDGEDDPATGSGIPDVDGLADPFERGRVAGGGASVNNTLLDWSRTSRADTGGRKEIDKWGRPYLYITDGTARRLVSPGPNGIYEPNIVDSDDIVLNF